MAKGNTDTFNLEIFTGTGQKAAHEVLADLYCKHVRLDADQDTVLKSLESDQILDLETYKHLISETGAEVYEQYRDSRHDYLQAYVVDEYLDGLLYHTEHKISTSPTILNNAFIKSYANVSNWKRSAEKKKDYFKTQMDIIEKDKLNFQNACLALEGDKRIVAHAILRRLEMQNNLPSVFLTKADPEETLLSASTDNMHDHNVNLYDTEVAPDDIAPYDFDPNDVYPRNIDPNSIDPRDLS